MGISRFYNRVVSTERQEDVGGGSKRQSWQQNIVGISCAIIPESAELVTVQNSAFYNRFRLWCSTSYDIQIGDRVIDENNEVYSVLGKAQYDGFDSSNVHAKYVLLKGK